MMSQYTIYASRRFAAFVAVAVASATLTACVWPNHRAYVSPRPILHRNSQGQATSPQWHYAPDRGGAVAAAQQQQLQQLRYRRVPVTFEQSIRAGYVLLDGGNYRGAVQTFRDAIRETPTLPDGWYHLACGYNRWAELGSFDEGEDPVDLRDRALGALDQAVLRGWTDLEHMAQDPDLASLRHRPEYREIVLRVHRQLGHAAYIGVRVDNAMESAGQVSGGARQTGVIVRHVDRPNTSQDAVIGPDANGLQAGDRIIALDLMPIHMIGDLRAALATKRPGDVIALQVVRNGRTLEVTFMLGARPGEKNRFLPTRPLPDPEATDSERPRVTSIDLQTGYVVINRGSEQGVEPGMVLTVTRDGRVQAQVEVLGTGAWRSHGRVLRGMPGIVVAGGDSVRPPTMLDAGEIADAIARRVEDDTVSEPAIPTPDPIPEAVPVAPAPIESEPVTGVPARPARSARSISVQDLIDMSTAGLSDETLIAMIHASRIQADSADTAVRQLRSAGLNDHVLAAVRIRMSKQN